MHFRKWMMLLAVAGLATACETDGPDPANRPETDPFERLQEEGVLTGRLNPFELVENPSYKPVHEVDFILDDEWVLITKACGYVLVYPHRSMVVEVVNEAAHGVYMAVTYCPITRSGIGLDRIAGEDTLLLTASGYLLHDNMVPMDVNSGSLWSQMQLKGLKGKHAREQFRTLPLIETTWKTVRDHFPGAGVFIREGRFKSAATDYRQEYGILSRDEVELFRLDQFPGEIGLIPTNLRNGGRVVVAGSSTHTYMTAFRTHYSMEPVEGQFPVIMRDETGTLWNLFGEAVQGERGGETLESPVSYAAADWAWRDLFDQVSYHTPE